jgi:alkylation response protein AidB-like acyl-CoA dehydrogenase
MSYNPDPIVWTTNGVPRTMATWGGVTFCGARLAMIHYSWSYDLEIRNLTCENTRCSSISTIFESTSEIQRLIVARAISGVRIK